MWKFASWVGIVRKFFRADPNEAFLCFAATGKTLIAPLLLTICCVTSFCLPSGLQLFGCGFRHVFGGVKVFQLPALIGNKLNFSKQESSYPRPVTQGDALIQKSPHSNSFSFICVVRFDHSDQRIPLGDAVNSSESKFSPLRGGATRSTNASDNIFEEANRWDIC